MKEYYAASLGDYFNAISRIAQRAATAEKEERKEGQMPLLWFRGLTGNNHTLLPTLYRGKTFKAAENPIAYNQLKQKEDARYQNFKSRTYHLIKTNPDKKSEWLEIYQHHFGRTRLMDWTESAKTALCFAVEALLDSRNDDNLKKRRSELTPTVTVINPCELNKRVYRYFYEHKEIIRGAIKEFALPKTDEIALVDEMQNVMKDNEKSFFAQMNEDIEMEGIVSLCVLEDMRSVAGGQLKQRLCNMECNPFYYLILRYYTDALPITIKDETEKVLSPLAVLHPYHSERIRKQRGTFSVYPNYIFSDTVQELYEIRKIDVRAMENQPGVNDLLSRIYITNPRQVAKELLYAGERRSELYPDVDNRAMVMEAQEYYI